MINDIRDNISIENVKKIFGNKDNAIEYLLSYTNLTHSNLKIQTPEFLYNEIFNRWNYEDVKFFTRHIAKQKKYSLSELKKNIKNYEETKKIIEEEFNGQKSWAFNVMAYDSKLTSTIRKNDDFLVGLDEHLIDIKKNYIIKSHTIFRSFLYEYYLIKHHEEILPTLSNNKSVDFFYNGKNFDLKNASSVTDNFKIDFGNQWMRDALNNPQTVARYLYENQNENRFDSSPRIFIVELENKIKSITAIEKDCRDLNFGETHKIDFDYIINGKKENFTTESLVVFI